MKRILLIGGAGYIGSHITLELIRKGYAVAIMDSLINSDLRNIRNIERVAGKPIPFEKANVASDKIEFHSFFRGLKFDAIIHLAAYKDVGESNMRPFMYYDNNIATTMNVIRIASITSTRNVIFSSSAAVYGNNNGVVREDMSLNPMSPYARTKVMSEDILRDTAEAGNLFKAVSLRYFNPLGVQVGLEISKRGARNVLDVLNDSVLTNTFKINGNDYPTKDGTAVRDFIHVSDVAEAHVATIEYMLANDFRGMKVYNVGRGKETSVKELLTIYNQVNGTTIEPKYEGRRENDIYYSQADVSKIEREIGWRATRNIEEMVKRYE